MKPSTIALTAAGVFFIMASLSCTGNKTAGAAPKADTAIAVFVPGIVSGNAVYEMLTAGAKKAADESTAAGKTASVTIVEAGTNQADWGAKLTELVAAKKYDLIISSNPSLPEIIEPISKQFPDQKFLVLDAFAEGNPKLATWRYNQREQAYVAGYMAAQISESSMKYANKEKKIGLVAGQEYPAMNDIILPAYLEGARAVDPAFTVDFRVVGNWYDATKAAELARAMHAAGVDVVMPIAGGANQGVVSAATDEGFYLAWFDENGYAKAPGYVIASSTMAQERLTREATLAYLNGKLEFGKPATVGVKEGYITFIADDPAYTAAVPQELRDRQKAMLDRLASGDLSLPVK
jgi:simple sugar transport system substrate-binding protein